MAAPQIIVLAIAAAAIKRFDFVIFRPTASLPASRWCSVLRRRPVCRPAVAAAVSSIAAAITAAAPRHLLQGLRLPFLLLPDVTQNMAGHDAMSAPMTTAAKSENGMP